MSFNHPLNKTRPTGFVSVVKVARLAAPIGATRAYYVQVATLLVTARPVRCRCRRYTVRLG